MSIIDGVGETALEEGSSLILLLFFSRPTSARRRRSLAISTHWRHIFHWGVEDVLESVVERVKIRGSKLESVVERVKIRGSKTHLGSFGSSGAAFRVSVCCSKAPLATRSPFEIRRNRVNRAGGHGVATGHLPGLELLHDCVREPHAARESSAAAPPRPLGEARQVSHSPPSGTMKK